MRNDISVEGFVADNNHPSGLRFPTIELAAAKVFAPEPDRSVTIRNRMDKGEAELCLVYGDGARYSICFPFGGLATADPLNQERWWEVAIRSAWGRLNERTSS
jgi:hypothetical protein